jgi:DNA-binding response OmpR family regulator
VPDSPDAPSAARRILLVEDHTDLRQYLERLLSRRGWSVRAYPSADEALDATVEVDLIVTDIMMPGSMDGLAYSRWVREQPALRRTPILVLTARTGRAAELEALSAGANEVITKPFDPWHLVERLEALLGV